jgi:uncharacterized surface protein with fasciclin (FAS1) repeats
MTDPLIRIETIVYQIETTAMCAAVTLPSTIESPITVQEQEMKKLKDWTMTIAVAGLIVLGFGASVSAIAGDGSNVQVDTADIVDTAVAAGQFNTLATALDAADLVSTLKGDGPFTVFAPTDEAFSKLPEGTVENLLKPENRDQLVAVLTYHVVPGKVMASDVVSLSSATTVQGSEVEIAVVEGSVRIDNATVITADVNASNGVIHVIDTVILPN